MPASLSSSKLLLVEGQDEVEFFSALLAFMSIADVQPWPVGGKDKFPVAFPTLAKDPNFGAVRAVAIVRDADQDGHAAFQSVSNLLKNLALPVPAAVGEVATKAEMKVGIFVMPGNKENGMLEDLCLKTVVAHPAIKCVDSFMTCLDQTLPKKGDPATSPSAGPFHPKVPAKAKAQAFLAAMHETVGRVGLAAQKGYWDFSHTTLDNLKSFLTKMFA